MEFDECHKQNESNCGKIEADGDEPDINCLDKFLILEPSDCVEKPGTSKASTGKPDARARRNSKPDAASCSQGSLKDAYLGGLMVEVAEKLAATDWSQESLEFFWIWTMERSRERSDMEICCIQIYFFLKRGILKLEAENGHIIFTCLQQSCLTWTRSFRS